MKIKVKLITGHVIRFMGDIDYHFEKNLLVVNVGSYEYQFELSGLKYFYIGTKHEGL